jgi:DUF1680 family protein
MPILVNGKVELSGKPGSYAAISRTWKDGDTLSFTLPMAFKCIRYTGVQAIAGHGRYALEYGPILMALTGPLDQNQGAMLQQTPEQLIHSLRPIDGEPLHFSIRGNTTHQYMPYWLVSDQTFTCFPVMASDRSLL